MGGFGPAQGSQAGAVDSAGMDAAFGSTQGSILYRGASAWATLAPGTSGQFLQTLGAAANPAWATVSGVTLQAAYDGGATITQAGAVGISVTSVTNDNSTVLTLAKQPTTGSRSGHGLRVTFGGGGASLSGNAIDVSVADPTSGAGINVTHASSGEAAVFTNTSTGRAFLATKSALGNTSNPCAEITNAAQGSGPGLNILQAPQSGASSGAGILLTMGGGGSTASGNGLSIVMTSAQATGSAISLTGGTITASAPLVTGTVTLNSGGTTFHAGLNLAVTETASAAASTYIRVLGGAGGATHEFSVIKGGVVAATSNYQTAIGGAFGFTASTTDPTGALDTAVRRPSALVWQFGNGTVNDFTGQIHCNALLIGNATLASGAFRLGGAGNTAVQIQTGFVQLGATALMQWSSGSPYTVGCDTTFGRISAGVAGLSASAAVGATGTLQLTSLQAPSATALNLGANATNFVSIGTTGTVTGPSGATFNIQSNGSQHIQFTAGNASALMNQSSVSNWNTSTPRTTYVPGEVIDFTDLTAVAANVGGAIGLAGRSDGVGNAFICMIQGYKENATSGNYLAGVRVFVNNNAGANGVAESIRWTSGRDTQIPSAQVYGISSAADNTAAYDTNLSRNAAGVIQFGTTAANASGSWLATNGTLSGSLTINAGSVVTDTTTGLKIGTGTTQKLGFYNATPIVQGASVADASGGVVIDAEARTAINALISRIEALGLIATV